jgi:di/tricarboxylate transporter
LLVADASAVFAYAVVSAAALPFNAPPFVCAAQAWSLLALFVTMVSGLVLAPLPTGAWAFLGATVGLLTHTLTFDEMFAAANNTVMWLVVVSFFLARVRVAAAALATSHASTCLLTVRGCGPWQL